MAVRTAEPGKARTRVGAVEIALDDLPNDRPEIPELLLETALVFGEETVEMVEEHPAKNRALRLAWAINSRHIGDADSKRVLAAAPGRSGGWAEDSSTNGCTRLAAVEEREADNPPPRK